MDAITQALAMWASEHLDQSYPICFVDTEAEFNRLSVGALDILDALSDFDVYAVLPLTADLDRLSRYKVMWYARIEHPFFSLFRTLYSEGVQLICIADNHLIIYHDPLMGVGSFRIDNQWVKGGGWKTSATPAYGVLPYTET